MRSRRCDDRLDARHNPVRVVRNGVLALTFPDGLRGEVAVLDRMRGPGFDDARTPEGFAKVEVDAETGRAR
jgi:hypothetical protein